jgi:hypothetical protein
MFRVGHRRRRVAAVTGVIAAVVIALALPAYGHSAILSGQTVCSDSEHVVNWTIGNDFDLPMEIVSATAEVDDTSYPVQGYTSPVPNLGETSATTIVPGGVTGTITLTVQVEWTDDNKDEESESVDLEEDCSASTTTSTSS